MFSKNSCVLCEYSITDPICRSCYINQTMLLLKDSKMHPVAREFILEKIKKSLPLDSLNETVCILCNQDNVAVCRYCFSLVVVRILKELNFSESLIENFEYDREADRPSLENELHLKRFVN